MIVRASADHEISWLGSTAARKIGIARQLKIGECRIGFPAVMNLLIFQPACCAFRIVGRTGTSYVRLLVFLGFLLLVHQLVYMQVYAFFLCESNL